MTSSYRTQLQDEKLPLKDEQTSPSHPDMAADILPDYTPSELGDQAPSTNDRPNQDSQPQLLSQAPRKCGFGQRFHALSSKAGTPLNKAANMIGAEGWWPSTMDKECDKAARILSSFAHPDVPTPPSSNGTTPVANPRTSSLVHIPPSDLATCAGLAIFNVLRVGGGHGSLAAGSGVVVARRADGTWSPPAAILVSRLGAGFNFGLDIYECVCVLRTPAQVDAFTRPRLSLGGDAGFAVGSVGAGAGVEAAIGRDARPVYAYIKSRGLRVGVQVDGTVVLGRPSANAAFYGEKGITAGRILRGDVAWPEGGKELFRVLHGIERRPGGESFPKREASLATEGVPAAPAGNEARAEKEGGEEGADVEFESVLDEKKRLAASGF